MRLTYCFAICLMQIISYAKGDSTEVLEDDTKPPTFVVKVESKKVISLKDTDKVHVVVTASNNDSSPFEGNVSFDVGINQDYDPDNSNSKAYESIDMVKGKAVYDFDIIELGSVFHKYNNVDKNIHVLTSVTNKLNGEINIISTQVRVSWNRYNLNRCVSNNSCLTYIADWEQDVVYQITHVDGSYVNDTESIVELTYSDIFHVDDYEIEYEPNPQVSGIKPLTFTGHMNETGFVHFEVSLPAVEQYGGRTRHFAKQLKYLDEESAFTWVRRDYF